MYFCTKLFKKYKMKYKIGDKVKCDGGDWWFYGTVSAIFEHSISPCYRLNIDRMEKKTCKFSITQFEFELEPFSEALDSDTIMRKWDNSEIELLNKYYGVLDTEGLSKMLKRSPVSIEEKWQQMKPEQVSKPKTKAKVKTKALETVEPPQAEETPPAPEVVKRRKRRSKQEMLLDAQKSEAAIKPKRKRGEAWDINFESYRNGAKSNVISTWVAQNRKEYKTGKLSEKKLEKLMDINFPFETIKKKKTITGTIA